MSEHILVEMRDVTAGYAGQPVLRNIDFTLRNRDFLGLIGPNGSGKTTLLKVILGLLKPSSGSVEYHFAGDGRFQARIGYLPQLTLFDRRFPITVKEVVLSGLLSGRSAGKRYSREERKRAGRLIDSLGISAIENRPVGEISGGQLQRTFLARALVSSPRLLLLDEPNTFVDKRIERGMFEILRDLNRDIAIVLVSHDLGMISSYVKTIACLSDGLHIHDSNEITQEILDKYHCPIDLITHGRVPHRVLKSHKEPGDD